jgi:type IV pilus assembly protein PilV
MIEVLVTIVIVAFGLLGLAGLQARLQTSEMESYQRSQALMLLNDMANRIATNRTNAANYVTTAGSPLGAGMTCPITTADVVQRDVNEWCLAVQGAGETAGGAKVGAMIGGKGCVEDVSVPASGTSPPVKAYRVTVAWQGLTPISAPPGAIECGAGSYNSTGTACINDLCRRTVTTVVRIATLS